MIELEVRDFQSIKQAKLTFEGFAVIVGPSNYGKTALFRALRTAIKGSSGNSFIRHGRPTAFMTFKHVPRSGDPLAINWTKDQNKTLS